MAQGFDARRRQLTGDAFAVVAQVQTFATVANAAFSISDSGLLAYQAGGGEPSQLVWFDRTGRESDLGLPPGPIDSPRLSRDGRRVAFRMEDRQGRGDIWIYDLTRRVSSRFTFDSADDFDPVWAPDDTRIVFSSNRESAGDLYVRAASGAGADEPLFASDKRKIATDWSRDGRIILFSEFGPMTQQDLWSLSLPERKATVVMQTEFFESSGQLSPDGRWMAYHSDESGRREVYVQSFPGPGPKWSISRDGGSRARWRGDGKELFFISDDGTLMAVAVKTVDAFAAEDPRPLFKTRRKRNLDKGYDVTPDGQRFIVNNTLAEENVPPITLVLNWAASLKR